MLTRDHVVTWLRLTMGHGDAESRVAEGAHAFLANPAQEGHYGGGWYLVLRRTGEYWHIPSYVDGGGLLNAASEAELREAMSAHVDLDRSSGTIVPGVARDHLVSWLAERHDWRHLDDRITDLGWMFLVNGQPDEFLDGTGPQDPTAGPLVVVKASGAVWWLPWAPNLAPALGAANEQEFHDTLFQAGLTLNPGDAHAWLTAPAAQVRQSPEATRELVARWLADTHGWQHLDDRITDLDWAFSVNTQPDAYLDGNENAMTYGNGPMMIIKRTGAIWLLSSRPAMVPVFGAADEHAFTKLMRTAEPFFDRDRPSGDRLPGFGPS